MLYVEDNENLRCIVAGYLGQFGYIVETAADGAEGWVKFSQDRFYLMITDLQMPNVDGFGLIRQVRESCRPVRIIVHSSALTEPVKEELHTLAVDATVHKESSIAGLRATLEMVARLPALPAD